MVTRSRIQVSTRKGLIIFRQNDNGRWIQEATHFLGEPVSLAFVDPRNGTWWAALDHGHWGAKLHRSTDEGRNWTEVEAPKYPEGEEIKDGVPATTKLIWAFAHGGIDKSKTLYVGTEPGGLFISSDGGDSFDLVQGLWEHPSRKEQWFGGGRDHPGIHSIVVDPSDSNHIYVGISCAGVFETVDSGITWNPRNKGLRADFLPDPFSDVGQDPHLIVAAPSDPKVMWQQNHCGIFKSGDRANTWTEVSENGGPAYFGFAIAVDETNAQCAWVAPAVSDETRVAVDGSLCICRTDDGGNSWQAFRKGLPQENVFDIVYRHAMDVSGDTVAFGTTTGNFYLSEDRGEKWTAISHNLPMIHAVDFIS